MKMSSCILTGGATHLAGSAAQTNGKCIDPALIGEAKWAAPSPTHPLHPGEPGATCRSAALQALTRQLDD